MAIIPHRLSAPMTTPELDISDDLRQDVEATLVSVIIPCYKQAHYLGEAIESILNQSCRNFEIVVVDDGSPDHTAEVAARYPEVRYVRQDNQGLSAARNTGIRESKGDYLVFLDADDRLLPTALETGIRNFRAHPECAFVSGAYVYIASDGTPLGKPIIPEVDNDNYLALLRSNYIKMHATVMYRRRVFEAIGGFDTSLKACEDYDLYLRIAQKFPVCCHRKVVAEYRQHGANMSGNPVRMLTTSLQVLRSQWSYVKTDKGRRRAYRRGVERWKEIYGRQLVRKAIAQLQTRGERRQGVQTGLELVRRLPLWVVTYPAKLMVRSILKILFITDPVDKVPNSLSKKRKDLVGPVKTER